MFACGLERGGQPIAPVQQVALGECVQRLVSKRRWQKSIPLAALFSAHDIARKAVGVGANRPLSAFAFALVALRDIGFHSRAHSRCGAVGCGTGFLARGIDRFARVANGGVVIECAFPQFVVGNAKRSLPIAAAVAPANEPHAAALVFAVAKMYLGVDALEVQAGR